MVSLGAVPTDRPHSDGLDVACLPPRICNPTEINLDVAVVAAECGWKRSIACTHGWFSSFLAQRMGDGLSRQSMVEHELLAGTVLENQAKEMGRHSIVAGLASNPACSVERE